MEQVEGMAKPCLALRAKLRNAADAILDMDDAVGAMVVRGEDAQFVVQNIGTGIALDVSYQLRNLMLPNGRTIHATCPTSCWASRSNCPRPSTHRPT